jgi:type IV fimbrial biogenesis protein FimT
MGTRRNESGFTIVELLVAIAIIGILSGIAIPTFSVWLPNYRLRTAALDLYGNLQLAKMQAIRTNGEYAVVFNEGGGFYQVVSGGVDRDFGAGGDDVVEKTVTLIDYGSGVAFGPGSAVNNWNNDFISTPVSYTPDRVVFDARGGGSPAGSVYVENEKNVRAFAVTSLINGFVRLRRWNGDSWN